MNILVVNCGSSSIKYQFIEAEQRKVLARGSVERIGMSTAMLSNVRGDEDAVKIAGEILDHAQAIEYIIAVLMSKNHGVISNKSQIHAVGHRVVHGGEDFASSVLVSDTVLKALRENIELAPLHNPHNIRGILAVRQHLPDVPHVCVFDTAFHHTIPASAHLYGLPYVFYQKHRVRRYGFHGTSHYYVTRRAAELSGRPIENLKLVSCHLGNGCSMAAVEGGISIDTTMGFTPLEGLLMGTRCGDLDPQVLLYIMAKEELSLAEVTTLLNKHSGLIGVSGISSDMREIELARRNGNDRAKLAFSMFCYRIIKYIGAYAAAMNGIDGIIFTGGIGENSTNVRAQVCESLSFLGVHCEPEKNEDGKGERMISPDGATPFAAVIPTNEELVIALDTLAIVRERERASASQPA